jgi:hypothetical protein
MDLVNTVMNLVNSVIDLVNTVMILVNTVMIFVNTDGSCEHCDDSCEHCDDSCEHYGESCEHCDGSCELCDVSCEHCDESCELCDWLCEHCDDSCEHYNESCEHWWISCKHCDESSASVEGSECCIVDEELLASQEGIVRCSYREVTDRSRKNVDGDCRGFPLSDYCSTEMSPHLLHALLSASPKRLSWAKVMTSLPIFLPIKHPKDWGERRVETIRLWRKCEGLSVHGNFFHDCNIYTLEIQLLLHQVCQIVSALCNYMKCETKCRWLNSIFSSTQDAY